MMLMIVMLKIIMMKMLIMMITLHHEQSSSGGGRRLPLKELRPVWASDRRGKLFQMGDDGGDDGGDGDDGDGDDAEQNVFTNFISVSVHCKDTRIVVNVGTNKPFSGRIYALGR